MHATTAFAGDVELRQLRVPVEFRLPMRLYAGVRQPHRIPILGQELAGEIEATGQNVTRFKTGDQVFALTGFRFGAYAEYICLPETAVMSRKPYNMSYEEAAAVPVGGTEALHFLRTSRLARGEEVLIYGAGGSIGTFAVQLARHLEAEVTAVDSAQKLDMLRALGASHVIDYEAEDFTQSGQTYDVILDVIGKTSYSRSLRALERDGR